MRGARLRPWLASISPAALPAHDLATMPLTHDLRDAGSGTAESTVEEHAVTLRFRDRVRLRHGSSELLVFRVGGEWFAVEVRAVDEAVEAPNVREVPETPPSLLGVFRHGDQLLPLYSPSRLLGVPAASGAIALVMRSGRRRLALAVDDVDDVVHLSMAELRDPPHREAGDEIVAGVCWSEGRLVAVLDARAVIGACTASGVVPA